MSKCSDLSMNVPDEGYSSNVPDECYSSNVHDEGYSSNVPDEGYSRNAMCSLNLISTFLFSLQLFYSGEHSNCLPSNLHGYHITLCVTILGEFFDGFSFIYIFAAFLFVWNCFYRKYYYVIMCNNNVYSKTYIFFCFTKNLYILTTNKHIHTGNLLMFYVDIV